MRFVFVHGWGFDAGFWNPLRDAMGHPESVAIDLGFQGAPQLDIARDEPYIAVGHSFGVQWLLHHCADHSWLGLVSINGFAKFTKADDFTHGTDPRLLRAMIAGFKRRPNVVFRDFMALCGERNAVGGALNTAPLLEGLQALNDWDERPALAECGVPVLALAGFADAVVSENMSRSTYADHHLMFKTGGNHLLARTDPQWCGDKILDFAKDLKT